MIFSSTSSARNGGSPTDSPNGRMSCPSRPWWRPSCSRSGPASVKAIVNALRKGKIEESRLEESCKKILRYKYLTGANTRKIIDTTNLLDDLNKYQYVQTRKTLFSEAITIAKNENNILPISHPDTLSTALVIIGTADTTTFETPFKTILSPKVFRLKHDAEIQERQAVLSGTISFTLSRWQ